MKPSIKQSSITEFLPNLCNLYTVFLGVIVTELLALILALAPLGTTGYTWAYIKRDFITDLAIISLFVQLSTLGSIGALCLIYRSLSRFNLHFIIVGLISYVLILTLTGLITEIAWQLNESFWLALKVTDHQLFLWRNLGISAIIGTIVLRYFYIQYHWKKETEAAINAHAQALQARIRPHFLFNCMNTIASLIRFQPDIAEEVVEEFAELFRASLKDISTNTKTCVTFKEELTLCQQYLHIEGLRLGERLQVVWEIDSIPKDALLPHFILQPLVENAIYHGIQPLPEGGTMSITGELKGERIKINVENPLAATLSPHKGNRMAQQNIQQRLQVFYETTADLSVQREANTYRVILDLPYKNQSYEDNHCR